MGIESDQLVFDYLSRVGDLAQQRQLPSKARMSLVASLRDEIARQREDGTESPAEVRRILARLGSPDAVVAAVEGGGLNVPGQRTADAPQPRDPDAGPEPDWWSVVPGFKGGVEIPELLAPPKPKDPPAPPPEDPPRRRGLRALLPGGAGTKTGTGEPAAPEKAKPAPGGTRLAQLLLPRRKKTEAAAPAASRKLGDPVLLLAAACLVLGTVTGSWLALAAGWLLAYATRRLTRTQAKWGVLFLPGAVAAGAAVWLWGRLDGRWGDRIAPGTFTQALSETWPWTLRTAALATAAYLFWQSRRK
ncbi:HAAS signaling domain-containing protein [Streptomyces sp. SudanB25_2051]|uniref:HAAS signaling domain-containing protein n=1 Tax=Streptomyces sp. SudanB25_2051 TaxID=3035275 RepID=UPI003F5449C0